MISLMLIIIIIAFLTVIILDTIALIHGGFTATLSWNVYLWMVKYPIIGILFGFVMGLLAGHFGWNQLLNVTVNTGCPR